LAVREEEFENNESERLNLSLEFKWIGSYTFDYNGEIDFHVKMYESFLNGELTSKIEVTNEVKQFENVTKDPMEVILAAFGIPLTIIKIIRSYDIQFIHYYAPMGSLDFIGKMMGNDFFIRFAIPGEECHGYRRFCGETLSRV